MLRFATVLTVVGCCCGPAAAIDDGYLSELVHRAHRERLAERQEWRALVHYQPHPILPGFRSLVDAPDFFNAPDGKTNPQAELEATLAGFFAAMEETNALQHPQCRFIARYRWLREQLRFDPGRLPSQPCRRFNDWRATLNPGQVTLIFPAAYLNNPASMFGHTLLRIDARDQDERTRLLAYAVNYAAVTGETKGLMFAINGLFGGYPGMFTIAPYYLKVREYNDIENRDIWEYRLDFTSEEIKRLLAHLWELGPVYFDYFFFDENCSYHLLSLLEVARPGLNLTDRFRWWTIPSDTVAAVTGQPGLLKQAVYRPAAATVLRHRLSQLPVARHALVRDLASRRALPDDARLTALAPVEQAAVIEVAYEYAKYRKLDTRDEGADSAAYLRSLLRARSRLPATEPPIIAAPAVRPDQGHGSARIDIGMGREGGVNYAELRGRAAYHDLLDAEGGYNRGAQVEYFALRLRRYEDESLRVEEFKPLDILSFAPRDEFFKPLSWKVNAGATRLHLPDGATPLAVRVNGGAGFTWEPGSARDSLASLLFEGTLDADNGLEHGYALGAGPALFWLTDLTPGWRLQLVARHQRFGLGHAHSASDLTLAQRYALSRDSALKLELARAREFGRYRNGAQLTWMVYF